MYYDELLRALTANYGLAPVADPTNVFVHEGGEDYVVTDVAENGIYVELVGDAVNTFTVGDMYMALERLNYALLEQTEADVIFPNGTYAEVMYAEPRGTWESDAGFVLYC